MSINNRKIPNEVMKALEATGLPFDFEPGGHHLKIRLANRMVGILPRAGDTRSKDRRTVLNVVSQIRRCAAGIT